MGDHVYRGVQGAELLLARQREAMSRLAQTPILVKVNTIVLPGINDGEIATVAAEVRAAGAEIMNTMAMVPVPGTPFESLGEPPPVVMAGARLAAGKELPQMSHCARCRADACGFIGEAPDSGSGIKRWLDLADLLHDCRAILTTGVGAAPRRVLTGSGIDVIEMEGLIEEGLSAVYGGTPIPASLRRTFTGCGLGCSGGGGGCG